MVKSHEATHGYIESAIVICHRQKFPRHGSSEHGSIIGKNVPSIADDKLGRENFADSGYNLIEGRMEKESLIGGNAPPEVLECETHGCHSMDLCYRKIDEEVSVLDHYTRERNFSALFTVRKIPVHDFLIPQVTHGNAVFFLERVEAMIRKRVLEIENVETRTTLALSPLRPVRQVFRQESE